jgi:hypothetical protein
MIDGMVDRSGWVPHGQSRDRKADDFPSGLRILIFRQFDSAASREISAIPLVLVQRLLLFSHGSLVRRDNRWDIYGAGIDHDYPATAARF